MNQKTEYVLIKKNGTELGEAPGCRSPQLNWDKFADADHSTINIPVGKFNNSQLIIEKFIYDATIIYIYIYRK